MRCVIHIGVPRTGSTSVQWVLWKNRDWFLDRGLLIPSTVGGQGQRRLSTFADTRVNSKPWQVGLGVRNMSDLKAQHASFREDLTRELQDAKGSVHTVVLSQERLATCSAENIERLKALLAPHFDSYTIVAFLRRQDLQRVSGQKNQTKNQGKPADPFDRSPLNYARILGLWSEVFGKESVTPLIFPDSGFERKDLIESFLAVIGIDSAAGLRLPEMAQNSGWDARAIELMALVNEWLPVSDDDGVRAARKLVEDVLTRGFPDGFVSYRPPRQAAMDYMKRHAESNETVRRRWFPGQASLFHDDFSMYPESAAVSLTLRDCAHVIAELAREGAVDPPDDKDDVDAAADEDA